MTTTGVSYAINKLNELNVLLGVAKNGWKVIAWRGKMGRLCERVKDWEE